MAFRVIACSLAISLSWITSASSELAISEFVAHEDSGLQDEDGDYSDWIELTNLGARNLSLTDYYLTDDSKDLQRWQFGRLVLAPGEYCLVFASGKNRETKGTTPFHTNFKLDKEGEYLALIKPDGKTIVQEFHPRYPAQSVELSFAHDPRTGEWGFTRPTPGGENGHGRSTLPGPVAISTQASTFLDTISINVPSYHSSQIRYTLNGELPGIDDGSFKADGSLVLKRSGIFRARAWTESNLGGPVSSEAFVKIDPTLQNFTSNLPILVIDNFSDGLSQNKASAALLIYEPTPTAQRSRLFGAADFFSRLGVKTRGSSSANYPKVSLRLELWNDFDRGKAHGLCGMPSEEDWILYGPYQTDPSLIRNSLAYSLSRQIGQYAPRTRFVEVFINTKDRQMGTEDYFGVYTLTEVIKKGDERVNLVSTDQSEDGSTTGYIFKQDNLGRDEKGFEVDGIGRLVWVFPKERKLTYGTSGEQDKRISYLVNYLNDFTRSLVFMRDPDHSEHYSDFIDVNSWVDELILQTLTKNIDAFTRSTYFFKPEGGRLRRGPVWDFDHSMAFDTVGWGGIFWRMPWWKDLTWMPGRPRPGVGDPDFMQAWTDRWQAFRRSALGTESIHRTIEQLAKEVEEAQVRNFERWPTLFRSTAFNGGMRNWEGEIAHLKGWLAARAAWIDEQFVAQPLVVRERERISVMAESEDTELYYTSDGSDPRLSGGSVSSSATLAKQRTVIFNAEKEHNFRFRVRKGIEWSGLLSISKESE